MNDEFSAGLRTRRLMCDHSFDLNGICDNVNVILVKWKGYKLFDNDYLNWATSILPMKRKIHRNESRCLERVESLLKDVEWALGIMKGRNQRL